MSRFDSVESGRCAGVPALLILLFSTTCFAAGDYDYLQSVERESSRIQAPVPRESAAAAVDSRRGDFEHMLEEQYRGTYAFYKRLTESSKQEVVDRYAAGADMQAIRALVHERYQQHR